MSWRLEAEWGGYYNSKSMMFSKPSPISCGLNVSCRSNFAILLYTQHSLLVDGPCVCILSNDCVLVNWCNSLLFSFCLPLLPLWRNCVVPWPYVCELPYLSVLFRLKGVSFFFFFFNLNWWYLSVLYCMLLCFSPSAQVWAEDGLFSFE